MHLFVTAISPVLSTYLSERTAFQKPLLSGFRYIPIKAPPSRICSVKSTFWTVQGIIMEMSIRAHFLEYPRFTSIISYPIFRTCPRHISSCLADNFAYPEVCPKILLFAQDCPAFFSKSSKMYIKKASSSSKELGGYCHEKAFFKGLLYWKRVKWKAFVTELSRIYK